MDGGSARTSAASAETGRSHKASARAAPHARLARLPCVALRIDRGLLAEIDLWAEINYAPTRSEVMRRLIVLGLRSQ
jgi:hypothetical protein